MKDQTTLIIGANSDIAKALAVEVIKTNQSHLMVFTRDSHFYQQDMFNNSDIFSVADYQESTIQKAITDLDKKLTAPLSQVFICHGLLHSEQVTPEKRLQALTENAFNKVMTANALTPMLWIKNLIPTFKHKLNQKQACKIVVFSARVGSISDNKIGGWYSYRASKAALNMLIKSAAVEFSRTVKNVKLISFHPGTTDTPLSKPFQKNVPEDKLFSSEFVALQLLEIVKNTNIDGEASFVDWQGKTIPW